MEDKTFRGRLVTMSNGCRDKLGFVIPWELILAVITMIAEYCQGLQ